MIAFSQLDLFVICDALNAQARHYDDLVRETHEGRRKAAQQTLMIWEEAADRNRALSRKIILADSEGE